MDRGLKKKDQQEKYNEYDIEGQFKIHFDSHFFHFNGFNKKAGEEEAIPRPCRKEMYP